MSLPPEKNVVPSSLRCKNHISAGKLLSPPPRAIAGPYLQRLQSPTSSKSGMLSSAFFGAAVTHNNVSDRKQTCLIVSAAVTYRNALTRDIRKSSSLGECRRLPASVGWGAGLGQVSQTYLSIIVTFREQSPFQLLLQLLLSGSQTGR